jgi:hypothetical protein
VWYEDISSSSLLIHCAPDSKERALDTQSTVLMRFYSFYLILFSPVSLP